MSAAGVHSFVPAEAETGGQYTRCTSLLTSCMYGNCFHGLIIAASPCIFCRNGAHFLLYPSVIFDKLSGDAQSCSFMWYRRIKKGAAGNHCRLLLQVLYKRPHPQNGGAFYYYTIIMFIWNYFSAMHAFRSFPALTVRNSERDKICRLHSLRMITFYCGCTCGPVISSEGNPESSGTSLPRCFLSCRAS